MANKTIYVSDNDLPTFEAAKNIAGEGLSGVISKALEEYVRRHEQNEEGMEEISIKIGSSDSIREQRFIGTQIGNWKGFSDDKEWWLEARIYRTKKEHWSVNLIHVCKASLLTDKKKWRESGDYLLNDRYSELFIASNISEFESKLPKTLVTKLNNFALQYEKPIEYLDI